jgi:hypothetical protein
MTARNIVIIVFIFLVLVVISAFIFTSRQNAAQNGMASIDQVFTQPLPAPSTVPPQGYVTVPTAYYISSNTPQNEPVVTTKTRTKTVATNPTPTPSPTKTVTPTPAPKPVDVDYWYYRWNGSTYVPYYPYTPDHKAPVNTEDLAFYSQAQYPAPTF